MSDDNGQTPVLMPADYKSWFAISPPGSTTLRCPACQKDIDLAFPSLDHHSSACPACGVESIFVSWKDVLVQIVPERAPAELSRAIRWAQESLDELEFVTVLSSLAEIIDAVQAGAPMVKQD